MGNCAKPKVCFICAVPGHHMNACPMWKDDHPVAAYVGSANLGLGFYHIEIPSVESTQWLNLNNCGVVRVKSGQISLAELEVELSEIYCRDWPWQIRELEPGKFLVRFPPHKRVADIKNYPSFNLRKEGVQVEVLEWIGDMQPYGVLQDVWVQMKGIPPRWCHWKVFAQIASGFGLMTDVDWATLFKSFYETVRIRIACKDPGKIPLERLYEMNKDLYLVSFTVEGVEPGEKGASDDKGDDGDDEDDDNPDDDGLNGEKDGTVRNLITHIEDPNSAREKTPMHKPNGSSRHKSVSVSCMSEFLDQEKQLLVEMQKCGGQSHMHSYSDTVSKETNDVLTTECKEVTLPDIISDAQSFGMVLENQMSVNLTPNLKLTSERENARKGQGGPSGLDTLNVVQEDHAGLKTDSESMDLLESLMDDGWRTPEGTHRRMSECHIVGNKMLNLVKEESQQLEWLDIRKLANMDGNKDECTSLLQRMELEDSDEESDLLDDDEGVSLEEAGLLPKTTVGPDDETKKSQKRKTKWGPMERFPRPRRHEDDGKTVLQKAQELKKYKNLEKGNYNKSFASESNTSLLNKAQCVNLVIGSDSLESDVVINKLKHKEKLNLEAFIDANPEVNLPSDIDLEAIIDDFPALVNDLNSPLRESRNENDVSWVMIVSKDKTPNPSTKVIK